MEHEFARLRHDSDCFGVCGLRGKSSAEASGMDSSRESAPCGVKLSHRSKEKRIGKTPILFLSGARLSYADASAPSLKFFTLSSNSSLPAAAQTCNMHAWSDWRLKEWSSEKRCSAWLRLQCWAAYFPPGGSNPTPTKTVSFASALSGQE